VSQILVIDDDRAIGDLIRDVLRDEGHEIVLVEHFEDAPTDLRPDLVITDLVGLRHYDTALASLVLGRIHARFPEVPIIVCSGHEQALRESARLGAAGVLRKPFSLETLVKITTDVIAG
jgi:two-component system nitrogen regulation response regulator NtrX